MRYCVMLLALLLVDSLDCAAQETPAWKVDGNSAKEFVAHLSSDAMQGRASGTPEFSQAAEWAAAKFQEWGLQPAGEEGTYFQKVKIRGYELNVGVPALRVATRDFYLDDSDFSVVSSASSPAVTCTGEVVFVGYGIAAPEKGLDEYAGLDVNGKVVVVFQGSPQDAPPMRRPLEEQATGDPAAGPPATDWTAEAQEITKITTAYQRGAAAILLFDPDESSQEPGRQRRGSRSEPDATFAPERGFLTFTISERVFRALMRPDPQESPGGLKRRMDVVRRDIQLKQPRSATTGIQVTMKGYDQSIRIDEKNGNAVANNVLARIEGTDPQLKDQVILVGAHLDHIGTRNGYVYNGADDNASGSGVVLEIARALGQGGYKPRRTLIFALWCGEELGLFGSLHYTKTPCAGVTMDNIVGSFNLDMVGMGEKLAASGARNFPAIWDVIQRNQDAEIMKIIEPSTGGPGGSDHSGFIRKGIETVFLISQGGVGHQDYHQPEDDIGKIEPEMLRKTGQFVLQGMMNLADESQQNLLIDRRQELYEAVRLRIANLNSQLENSSWTVVDLKSDATEALHNQVLQEVRQLKKPAPPAETSAARRGSGRPDAGAERPSKSVARALTRMELIGTDVRLLDLVLELYAIGRVEIAADNPFWSKEGRLTAEGKSMLAAFEQRKIALHLVSPGPDLLKDVLDSTSRPFAVTGTYDIPEEIIERVGARGVLLGVNLDPKTIPEFLARVEQLKTLLGERRNLFAYLTSADGLEEAKSSLYLGLLDRGWARNEISGDRAHRGLLGGAALNSLIE
ncbi:MAG: M28 family peptidase [Pirellulaceae bacterium]